MSESFVKDLVAGIDSFDPKNFVAFLTEDVSFRFGNGPVVSGRDQVEDYIRGFFEVIRGIKHEPVRTLKCGDVLVGEMMVGYIDQWGRGLKVPVCNLMTMRGDKICDYRIFIDNSALFMPPAS